MKDSNSKFLPTMQFSPDHISPSYVQGIICLLCVFFCIVDFNKKTLAKLFCITLGNVASLLSAKQQINFVIITSNNCQGVILHKHFKMISSQSLRELPWPSNPCFFFFPFFLFQFSRFFLSFPRIWGSAKRKPLLFSGFPLLFREKQKKKTRVGGSG